MNRLSEEGIVDASDRFPLIGRLASCMRRAGLEIAEIGVSLRQDELALGKVGSAGRGTVMGATTATVLLVGNAEGSKVTVCAEAWERSVGAGGVVSGLLVDGGLPPAVGRLRLLLRLEGIEGATGGDL